MRLHRILPVVTCLLSLSLLSRPEPAATAVPQRLPALPGPMDDLYAETGDLNYSYGPSGARLRSLVANAAANATTSTFAVTYTGFTPSAQAAFQAAVAVWANTIVSPVPIRINAQYRDLGSPNILGSAGPAAICGTAGGQSNTYYAAALADKLQGTAFCAALGGRVFEINANLNSTFTNWDFGTTGAPVAGKYNFLTVVMHEIGHGLGFYGSMSMAANGNGSFRATPDIYDRFAVTGAGAALLGFANPSLALGSQLVSNNTFFNGTNARAGNGGASPKLETHSFSNAGNVNGFLQGSSYSHLDDGYSGTPNGLMTWSLAQAEVYTDPGPITRGMFQDEGWQIAGSTMSLAVSVVGSGAVVSSPAGISCAAASCQANFGVGASVSLTPTPAPGWIFLQWGGACSGTGSCVVSMTSNRNATATFQENGSVFERVAVGLGPLSGAGGWIASRKGAAAGFEASTWAQVPWPAYNANGGGVHVAAGDVDGDGLDEIVVGLGPGGAGWMVVFDDAAHGFAVLKWIQVDWPAYNAANGEVWPAVGDIDGDGRAEIVAGLGSGGLGWFEIFDDAAANFAHIAWRQVDWPAYSAGTGATHPAIGNLDGIGASEIVIGLGSGGGGYLEVFTGAAGGFSHQAWLQVDWPAYNAANGTTFPAAGDLDGDGRAEIVVGLGNGGGGWLRVFDDAASSFAHAAWLRVDWPAYNTEGSGETHPAVGNIDNDARAEIVVGLDQFSTVGGYFVLFDDAAAGLFAHRLAEGRLARVQRRRRRDVPGRRSPALTSCRSARGVHDAPRSASGARAIRSRSPFRAALLASPGRTLRWPGSGPTILDNASSICPQSGVHSMNNRDLFGPAEAGPPVLASSLLCV